LIFPATVFLLAYYFGFSLTRKKWLGILSGLGVVIGEHLVTPSPASFMKILTNYGSGFQPLEYTRLLHPQFTAISFFIALILLYKALEKKSYKLGIASGLVFGTLFYQDIYFWTYFATGLGLLVLAYLLKKDFINFKINLLTGFLAGIVSIPHWINNYFLTANGDVISRSGLTLTRAPDLFVLIFGILLIALFYLAYRKTDHKFIFISCFTFAFVVAMNIQVVLGVTLQPYHWFLRAGSAM